MEKCTACGHYHPKNQPCHQLEDRNNKEDETVLLFSLEDNSVQKVVETNRELNSEEDYLFNRYKIIKEIGKGGMGTVYLAEDKHLKGKLWAIKEVHIPVKLSREFIDEAKILTTLEHINLPKVVDFYNTAEQDEKAYLVMDYINGKTLTEVFEQENHNLPYERVIKYAIQLCNVLEYLHHQKPNPIIYRDLKPSNIIINHNDDIRLIDFGIAREFKENHQKDTIQVGTMGFASPEQFENVQTDHRSDIFSLGAMLYFLLSRGRYIYTTQQPLNQIRPDLPFDLVQIVTRLTQMNPNGRYQSVRNVKQDLVNVLTPGNVAPIPVGTPDQYNEKPMSQSMQPNPPTATQVVAHQERPKKKKSILRKVIGWSIFLLAGYISYVMFGYKYLMNPETTLQSAVDNMQAVKTIRSQGESTLEGGFLGTNFNIYIDNESQSVVSNGTTSEAYIKSSIEGTGIPQTSGQVYFNDVETGTFNSDSNSWEMSDLSEDEQFFVDVFLSSLDPANLTNQYLQAKGTKEYEIIGKEKKNDITCIGITVSMNAKSMIDYLGPIYNPLVGSGGDFATSLTEMLTKKVKITYWIGKEDKLIHAVDTNLKIPFGDYSSTVLITDYNGEFAAPKQ